MCVPATCGPTLQCPLSIECPKMSDLVAAIEAARLADGVGGRGGARTFEAADS